MPRVIAFDPAELSGLYPPHRSHGCDFCATGTPIWHYPAKTVGLGVVCYGETAFRPISLGHWVACSECSDLVEAGDWLSLARRSLRSLNLDFSQAGPGMRVQMLAQITGAHEAFRHARLGPQEIEAP